MRPHPRPSLGGSLVFEASTWHTESRGMSRLGRPSLGGTRCKGGLGAGRDSVRTEECRAEPQPCEAQGECPSPSADLAPQELGRRRGVFSSGVAPHVFGSPSLLYGLGWGDTGCRRGRRQQWAPEDPPLLQETGPGVGERLLPAHLQPLRGVEGGRSQPHRQHDLRAHAATTQMPAPSPARVCLDMPSSPWGKQTPGPRPGHSAPSGQRRDPGGPAPRRPLGLAHPLTHSRGSVSLPAQTSSQTRSPGRGPATSSPRPGFDTGAALGDPELSGHGPRRRPRPPPLTVPGM